MSAPILSLSLFLSLFFHPMDVSAKSFLPPSFRADYEQTIKKKISGKLKRAVGRIEYRYPGNIRFEQTRPENVIWVSNPKTTWFYQAPFVKGEPGNLRTTPTNAESPAKIFDLLKNGLKESHAYTVVKKSDHKIELIFKPKKTPSKFQKAILTFRGSPVFKNLRSIKMLEKNGNPLELTFQSLDIGVAFKPEHFVFVAPPNTRLEGP